MPKTVVVTGSQGFIGSYLCKDLLDRGYKVVGYDNFSKYGRVSRPHDGHKNFRLFEFDLAKRAPRFEWHNPDYIIAGAAMIGGISYFHKYAYDLLATNERIIANTFDSAIKLWNNMEVDAEVGREKTKFKKIVVISSSMVFEGADAEYDKLYWMADSSCCGSNNFEDPNNVWPTCEGDELNLPPPNSTYGFQKLATEYFCKGAHQQYGLPCTIVRPFNCVGVGEDEAIGEEEVMSGNVKLMMSHVLPDLINKCLLGQDPLHILGDGSQIRCYTNGRDISRGIIMAMESDGCEDFNISTSQETTVLELAKMVWSKINPDKPFRYISDKPYECDVQKRIPSTRKAFELLGFEAQIGLEESVDEVIAWMRGQHGA